MNAPDEAVRAVLMPCVASTPRRPQIDLVYPRRQFRSVGRTWTSLQKSDLACTQESGDFVAIKFHTLLIHCSWYEHSEERSLPTRADKKTDNPIGMRHRTVSRHGRSCLVRQASPALGITGFGTRRDGGHRRGAFEREESVTTKTTTPTTTEVDLSEAPREQRSLASTLAEKVELSVQGAFALAFGAALAVSAANILVKLGVITFALVTVAVRYTVVGIFLVVIVACVL